MPIQNYPAALPVLAENDANGLRPVQNQSQLASPIPKDKGISYQEDYVGPVELLVRLCHALGVSPDAPSVLIEASLLDPGTMADFLVLDPSKSAFARIATNAAAIAANVASIAAAQADAATAVADAAAAQVAAANNAIDIAALDGRVTANESDIADLQAENAAQQAEINTNTGDIATNAADIAATQAVDAAQQAQINTNIADIASNAANIAANTAAINGKVGAASIKGAINGLKVTVPGTTLATIEPGQARNSTNVFDLVVGATLNLDASVVGVNGLDTGALANDTWYYVFVIGDTGLVNPTCGLISASPTAPILPVGYDVFRRVGTARRGTAAFLPSVQHGNGSTRDVRYLVSLFTQLRILNAGNATAFTTVSAAAFVPPNVSRFLAQFEIVTPVGAAGDAYTVAHKRPDEPGGTITTVLNRISHGIAISGGNPYRQTREVQVTAALREFQYGTTDAGGTVSIAVAGYTIEL